MERLRESVKWQVSQTLDYKERPIKRDKRIECRLQHIQRIDRLGFMGGQSAQKMLKRTSGSLKEVY